MKLKLSLALAFLLSLSAVYAAVDFDNSNDIVINGGDSDSIEGLQTIIQQSIEGDLPQQNMGYLIEFNEIPLIESKTMLEKDFGVNELEIKVNKLDNEVRNLKPAFWNIFGYVNKIRKSGELKDKKSKLDSDTEEIQTVLDIRKKVIEDLHKRAKEDILGSAGAVAAAAKTGKGNKILGEYSKVFSGIALNISAKDLPKVRELPYVKSVSPNLEVKALLMDSVPLIEADEVWQLDRDGNKCEETGKECLTGKGVTIAVIDTGVDYTHPDLGGCLGGVKPAQNAVDEQKGAEIKETVEANQLIPAGVENYNLELDLPNHFDDSLRHPKKFFSGNPIRIVSKKASQISYPTTVSFSRRDETTKDMISVQTLEVKKVRENYFTVEAPLDAKSGYYTLEFKENNGDSYNIPIRIEGLTDHEKESIKPKGEAEPSIKRLSCQNCYWESVLGINPNDENYGYFIGGGASDYLIQTVNGWDSHNIYGINGLTNPIPRFFRGDPKVAFTDDGKLVVASLLTKVDEPITGGIYQDTAPKNTPPQFKQTLLSEIPDPSLESQIVFDYEKISIDNSLTSKYYKNMYVFANTVYFKDVSHHAQGLFIVDPTGKITVKNLGPGSAVTSTAVGPDGEVYASRPGVSTDIFVSLDGGETFTSHKIADNPNIFCTILARTSTISNRAWFAYGGPEIAVSNDGTLYAVWATPRECSEDSDFEYSVYGYDLDVHLSYSTDKGVTWSTPVRVNDDTSAGDQAFPSISIGKDGTVYVAFLDHRDNQDKGQFDVYLSESTDGGNSFSKNMKVNDISVPNIYGHRMPGDYLDMLTAGKDNLFVGYPCVNKKYTQSGFASDACVSKFNIPLNLAKTLLECSDKEDNDKDGLTDYPEDHGCASLEDNDEKNADTSCKVIGGYDFVNQDNDPMDDMGHGTHVAATAAGNGILKGVAPDAKIIAYKVLDSGGSGPLSNIISAIERSVDPNSDGDFSDHADVISMSLGAPGNPEDAMSKAVDKAVDAGVSVVVAAGNSGPKMFTVMSPGAARKAITIGASFNKNSVGKISKLKVNDKIIDSAFFSYSDYSNKEQQHILSGEMVHVKDIKEIDNSLKGKIVIFDILNSIGALNTNQLSIIADSGAAAVIGYDSSFGTINNENFARLSSPISLPLVLVGFSNSELILSMLKDGAVNAEIILEISPDRVVSFSSRGPVFSAGGMTSKPDLLAPGVGICAAQAANLMPNRQCFDDKHIQIEGTSMATPHIAGVAALMKQAHFDWDPLQIKATLKGTAINLMAYSYLIQGSGRVDVQKAITQANAYPIASLDSPDFLSGTIIGTAWDDDFVDYTLEYGEGMDPSKWTLAAHSSKLVKDGVLGTLDLSKITSSLYAVRLTVADSLGHESKEVLVKFKTYGKEGWPQAVQGGFAETLTMVANVDTDSSKEILVSSPWITGTSISVFEYDGQLKANWPKSVPGIGMVVAGNLDSDKESEIVYVAGEILGLMGLHATRVYAWNSDGSDVKGWPVDLPQSGVAYSSASIADIDNNGKNEVITYAGRRIYALENDGKEKWHVDVEMGAIDTEVISPTVADINGDGYLETVFTSLTSLGANDGKLYVIDHNGNLKEEFLLNLGPRGGEIAQSLITGDINRDGVDEIIVRKAVSPHNSMDSNIIVIDSKGEIIYTLPPITRWDLKDLQPMELANLDEDDDLEIVNWEDGSVDGKPVTFIRAYNFDGSMLSGFPVTIDWDAYGAPWGMSVGDINGDKKQDILIASRRFLLGFDSEGNPSQSFPIEIFKDDSLRFIKTHDPIVISDLENNGKPDIIFTLCSPHSCSAKLVNVFELDNTFDENGLEWPQFQYDAPHTGRYYKAMPALGDVFADIKADGSDEPITLPYGSSAALSWKSLNAAQCNGFNEYDLNNDGFVNINDAGLYTKLNPGKTPENDAFLKELIAAFGTKSDYTDWKGHKPLSGSENIGSISKNRIFGIDCVNLKEEHSYDIVKVTVTSPEKTLFADIKADSKDELTAVYGSIAALSWTSSNAESCTAFNSYDINNDGFVNANDLSLYKSQNPNATEITNLFLKEMMQAFGTTAKHDTLWIGSKSTSGLQASDKLNENIIYGISCKSPDSKYAYDYVKIFVKYLNPAVSIKANNLDGQITIPYDSSAVLSWLSENSDSCAGFNDYDINNDGFVNSNDLSLYSSQNPASNQETDAFLKGLIGAFGTIPNNDGAWIGSAQTSGTKTTKNLLKTTNYGIWCKNSGKYAYSNVLINVNPPLTVTLDPIPPTPIPTPVPLPATINLKANNLDELTVASGSSITLSWDSSNANSCNSLDGYDLNGDGAVNINDISLYTSTHPGSTQENDNFFKELINSFGSSYSDWKGEKAVSGSNSIGGLTKGRNFIIICNGNDGHVSDNVTVYVNS